MICGTQIPGRVIIEARERDFPADPTLAEPPVPRFGTAKSIPPISRTAWRRSPSSIVPVADCALPALNHIALGTGIGNGADVFAKATVRGTAWHLAFRALCTRPDLRDALAASTGLESDTLEAIATQVKEVRDWLSTQGYDQLHFELPMQEISADGSETNAIIDCLAEGADGYLILDHKSGPCPDPDTRFADYLPQFLAYAELISARGGKPVRQIAINWMNEGMISIATVLQKENV
jgi:ATP-dependent helicase/nuclease subunit A